MDDDRIVFRRFEGEFKPYGDTGIHKFTGYFDLDKETGFFLGKMDDECRRDILICGWWNFDKGEIKFVKICDVYKHWFFFYHLRLIREAEKIQFAGVYSNDELDDPHKGSVKMFLSEEGLTPTREIEFPNLWVWPEIPTYNTFNVFSAEGIVNTLEKADLLSE